MKMTKLILAGILILSLTILVSAKEFKSELEEIQYAQDLFSKAEKTFANAETLYAGGNQMMNKDNATVKDINDSTQSFLKAADQFGAAEKYYSEANVILAKYVKEETEIVYTAVTEPEPIPEPEPIVYQPEPEPIVYQPEPEPVVYHQPQEVRTLIATVNFSLDEASLTAKNKERLQNIIPKLKNPGGKIYIEGHTCDLGTYDYNQNLSEKRAISVVKYLVSQGFSVDDIVEVGYGEGSPVASNDTENNRSKNRRVEVYLVQYE
ncbi:MAG: OmpA family protein [bacterium]|nr:OmpA family protein [bacterium]